MVPIAFALGAFFLVSFLKALMSGEYDDLESPAIRAIKEDIVDQYKGEKL